MNRLVKYLLAAIAVAVIAVLLAVTNVGPQVAQAGPPGAPVTVQNVPLPVDVQNPALPVNVQNAPLSVNVGNWPDPVPVRDVDNPAYQPFVAMKQLSVGYGFTTLTLEPPVPDGKRLVIEYASVRVHENEVIPLPSDFEASIYCVTNSVWYHHEIPLTQLGQTIGKGAQVLRVYRDPNTGASGPNVIAEVANPMEGHDATFTVTISGHLVDVAP